MFNACRIPRPVQDSYAIYDPKNHTHAVVARKGHFFAIELVDSETCDPLPLAVIEDQLQQCLQLAESKSPSASKLGILTSNNRDNWAAAREELLNLGGAEMEEALSLLQSGAVLVNLDEESPRSRTECGELFLSGGMSSGENRWFDKSIQLVVTDNGKSAAVCEHSMMDGMPCVNFAGYITNFNYDAIRKRSNGSSNESPKVIDIFGDVIEKMEGEKLRKLEREGKDSLNTVNRLDRIHDSLISILPSTR
jgi:carnitine O-acetyltransferase